MAKHVYELVGQRAEVIRALRVVRRGRQWVRAVEEITFAPGQRVETNLDLEAWCRIRTLREVLPGEPAAAPVAPPAPDPEAPAPVAIPVEDPISAPAPADSIPSEAPAAEDAPSVAPAAAEPVEAPAPKAKWRPGPKRGA